MGYLASQGKGISRKKLKPGDMVFYPYKDTSLGHVAIYIGKGLIVNSSGFFGTVYPRGGIRISTLDYRSPHANRFRNVVGN
jgi:cell wall-associated NlpC family hydrolase